MTDYIDITHRHTFGIATRAKEWQEYTSAMHLTEILRVLQQRNIPFMPIGAGSNLLFLHDYEGTLLHSAMTDIEVVRESDEYVWVRAGSGVVWDDFVSYCVEKGWGGIENLSYIPGEVGASAVQNIGAYGVEVCDVIEAVDGITTETLQPVQLHRNECNYGYRCSIFKQQLRGKVIVTAVTYRLSKQPTYHLDYGHLRNVVGDMPTLQSIREAVIAIRRDKLPEPAEQGSAGSFFVNPVVTREHYERLLLTYPDMPHYAVDDEHVKVPAGWLIDRQGWRGKSVGGAMVYPKQCLVIVNADNATAGDVTQLAADIAASVQQAYGITIHPEVNYIS